MTTEELFAKLAELPPTVQDFVFGDEAGEANLEIADRQALPEPLRKPLFDLINEIIVRQVSLDALEPEIEKRLGLDKVKATALALEVAGRRLLALDKWLGDVSGCIRRLGGDLEAYGKTRVQLTSRTPDEATADLLQNIGVSDMEPHLRDRLKELINSVFHGVRTTSQLQEVLMRAAKVGGLGMSETQANIIVEEVAEEARATLIGDAPEPESAPEPPAPLSRQQTTISEPQVPKKPAGPRIDAPTEEDEKEAGMLYEKFAQSSEAGRSAQTADKIKASIDELTKVSGISLPDPVLQERLKTVIGNRLRDVRDSLETLEILVQPKELGGLSLSEDVARGLLKHIDEKLRAVHEAHRKEIEAGKSQWIQSEAAKKETSEMLTQKKNVVQLDNLYQSIVAKSSKAQAKTQQSSAATVRAPAKAEARPVPAGTVQPAAASPTNLPFISEAKNVPQPLTVVRPAPQMAAGPSVRPLMQDVKPVSRPAHLTGPAEELRTTGIIDFRRLSKDPVEACAKIETKLEILHRHSYEKRTEGIQAWLESEVYNIYLQMMREALDGKPLPQVIAERQAAGRDALTIEEIRAIADLSRKLRY